MIGKLKYSAIKTKQTVSQEWYIINNVQEADTPALVVYEDRVTENIRRLTTRVDSITRLRPHVKTNKIAEVCRQMKEAGIGKYKCATIAEAEMLGMIMAPDVLLAYQPVGPKIQRLIALIKNYPGTHYSCLVDNVIAAKAIAAAAVAANITIEVWIDLNIGQNRTGIVPGEKALQLWTSCNTLPGIRLVGLHAYDGHIQDTDLNLRQQRSDKGFEGVKALAQAIQQAHQQEPKIVAGGSPTFPTHMNRPGVQCSPGTFVFWDYSYKHVLPDEPYEYAALVITRVISIIDNHTICTDLGHKSVAAENPLPRVHFLNAPGATPVAQSEEHLVLKVEDASAFPIGEVLYGIPVHICPTVALYEKAITIKNNTISGQWNIIARDRKINI